MGKVLRGAQVALTKLLIGRKLRRRVTLRREFVTMGNPGAAWSLDVTGIGPSSVVYSFGIGEDISFDLELMRRTGAQVHAFDPTPKSLAWLKTQALPAGFHVHAYGLGVEDGTLRAFLPADASHVSASPTRHGLSGEETVELSVRSLGTIMRELGHARVDVLKMDIEGGEYAVIARWCEGELAVGQLLVEFHDRFETVGKAATIDALARLRVAGYRVFSISERREEYALARV